MICRIRTRLRGQEKTSHERQQQTQGEPPRIPRRYGGHRGRRGWASYVARSKQYTEYYDLAGDPYQLTNELYQTTPQDEQNLGVPTLAVRRRPRSTRPTHHPTEPPCPPAAPPDTVTRTPPP
ncbi:hypothetical protein ABZW02_21770 [Streptomyces sp. NPDC005180]|uniref:hypothetical protein n=1 Tax=Streptomyces sp. NPDC005180 TaxID=3156868 RepID=UPI0033B46804